jgi:hypothetical protein
MLETKEKEAIIYALEEWTKVLEAQGNIGKRNEIMELTWKVSSSLGRERMTICGDHLVPVKECGCRI